VDAVAVEVSRANKLRLLETAGFGSGAERVLVEEAADEAEE
jgi:hypothetical protein